MSHTNTTSFSVKLHELCNERCLFCFQDHETRKDKWILSSDEGYRVIYTAFKEGYRNIQFTWGEPLLHPKIITFIAFAKKVWFEVIGVHSNWVRFHDEEFLRQCIAAGLNNMNLSIHHIKWDINDHIVWLKGWTEKSLQCIDLLEKYGIYTVVYIVLNQFNYRDLKWIVKYFFSKGIYQIVIMFPTIQWWMEDEKQTTMVSYNEVAPYIMETLWLQDWLLGKYIYLFNIPACIVPGYEQYIMTTTNAVLRDLDGSHGKYFDIKQNSNMYPKICNTCAYRDKCPGIDIPYISSYGEESFQSLIENKNLVGNSWNIIDDTQWSNQKLEISNTVNFLRNLFSREYLLGLSVPILWYDHASIENAIWNSISDVCVDIHTKLQWWFAIHHAMNFFNFEYQHIEFKINSSSQKEYWYILWFNKNKRFEILHYILSIFSLNLEKIKILYAVYSVFAYRENLFHLWIDESTKRVKLYISLYNNTVEEAEILIHQLKIIFNKENNQIFENTSQVSKYDCIWIDITDSSIELKIYELINLNEKKDDFIYQKDIIIKEQGYMRSLSWRKKLFFRFLNQVDIKFFKNEFDIYQALDQIKIDLAGKHLLQWKVKYYCSEWEKQEIYFI